MNRLLIWVKTLFYHLASFYCVKKSTLLTSEETTRYILNYKKSLIRFGDGEFIIMSGNGIAYQEFNPELQQKLKDILNEYLHSSINSNYIICMPKQFLEINGLRLSFKRLWVSCWAKTRYYFKYLYDKEISYGDSFLFASSNEPIYNKIWNEYDNIIFVHNKKQYAENFSKKYKKNTVFIKTPSENAYTSYSDIYKSIKEKNDQLENCLVLISCGPTAKILVYELCKNGVMAIDTGHCWDNPLEVI